MYIFIDCWNTSLIILNHGVRRRRRTIRVHREELEDPRKAGSHLPRIDTLGNRLHSPTQGSTSWPKARKSAVWYQLEHQNRRLRAFEYLSSWLITQNSLRESLLRSSRDDSREEVPRSPSRHLELRSYPFCDALWIPPVWGCSNSKLIQEDYCWRLPYT